MDLARLLTLSGLLLEARSLYYVLVKDGIAKALPATERAAIAGLENDGWEIVDDAARSPEEGYRTAARLAGAQPDAPDAMNPQPMSEPKVLYRAVSLPELVDIARRGSIHGKLNVFNEFDRRRHVFFADVLNANVIHQGEELERQAAVKHHKEFTDAEAAIQREIEAVAQKIAKAVKPEVASVNRQRVRKGREAIDVMDADILAYGRGERSNDVEFLLRSASPAGAEKIKALVKERQALRDRLVGLSDRFRTTVRATMRDMTAAREGMKITSAVLETRPIAGGLHYSKRHGQSGMGEDDEYGFPPDQVTLRDIRRIHWVKDGKVIETTSADTLADDLERFGL